jgi:hypothetical protein
VTGQRRVDERRRGRDVHADVDGEDQHPRIRAVGEEIGKSVRASKSADSPVESLKVGTNFACSHVDTPILAVPF